MRQRILGEIQRLAAANDGKAPGSRAFEQATGIGDAAWRGVYWARWNDALKEAGVSANPTPEESRIADDILFAKFAEVFRVFGRAPTIMEFRIYRRDHPDCPNHKTVARRFGAFSKAASHLRDWVADKPEYADVADLLRGVAPDDGAKRSRKQDGSVYLLQSGAYYKIGRSDDLERRVKEITTAMPEKLRLVHTISTDDSSGIEAYWHRRFADRRANGEWFKLTADDVAAFRRRRFQ